MAGEGLAELQALLNQQPQSGGAWSWLAPVRRQQASNNMALAQRKQDAITSFMLPLQVRVLEAQASGDEAKAKAAQLELKAFQEQLAGENDIAAGLGMTRGQFTTRLGAAEPISRMQENLARAGLMNQQARSVASEMDMMSDPNKLIDYIGGLQGYAPGELQEKMRLDRIGQNAQGAEAYDAQQSVHGVLDEIEGAASLRAGKPLALFNGQDRREALAMFQSRVARGMSPQEALGAVQFGAAKAAQGRLMELTQEATTSPQTTGGFLEAMSNLRSSAPGTIQPGLPAGVGMQTQPGSLAGLLQGMR